jgi:2-hydroxy-6-oxonona-2,4-dienedioate hydrolase
LTLYAYRAGAGAPVVCVHGIGVTSRYFEPLADVLAADRRVLVPDLPGWGRSPRPPHTLNLQELADALAGFLDAEGLTRVPLVANSLGCQIAVELAVRHPERVSALVLVGPTVDPGLRTFALQARSFLLDSIREPVSLWWIIARDYARMGPLRFARTAHFALRQRMEDLLPRVEAPTLVVRGEHDRFVSQAWSERATELLPRGSLAIVHGEAHAAHYSAPVRVAGLVRSFLEEVEERADEG